MAIEQCPQCGEMHEVAGARCPAAVMGGLNTKAIEYASNDGLDEFLERSSKEYGPMLQRLADYDTLQDLIADRRVLDRTMAELEKARDRLKSVEKDYAKDKKRLDHLHELSMNGDMLYFRTTQERNSVEIDFLPSEGETLRSAIDKHMEENR